MHPIPFTISPRFSASGLLRGRLWPRTNRRQVRQLFDSEKLRNGVEYEVNLITPYHNDPRYVGEWRRLVLQSESSEKIYQTPEFFRFLIETSDGKRDRFELFAVTSKLDGAIVGIIPVRIRKQLLPFFAGDSAGFGSMELRLVTILGSVPLMPQKASIVAYVFDAILNEFPGLDGFCMPALPSDCDLSRRMVGVGKSCGFTSYVLDGWRDCHTLPLPPDFDSYLQKFSAKKRYNLSRQVRLLEKEAGPIHVTRITMEKDVPTLVAALDRLLDAGQLGNILGQREFASLAANKLLLCYVISCGNASVGVLVGTRSADAWHIHNIYFDQQYSHLSVGTSAIYLSVRDVIENFTFARADFGYGTPNSDFRSSHVLHRRGNVLFCPDRSKVRFLFSIHRVFNTTRSVMVLLVKSGMKAYKAMRLRLRATKTGHSQ